MTRYWPLALAVLVLAGLLWWVFGGSRGAPGVHFARVRHLTIESTVPTNGRVEPVEWGAARAEITPPELFEQLFHALDDPMAALDARFGREALAAFTRDLESTGPRGIQV